MQYRQATPQDLQTAIDLCLLLWPHCTREELENNEELDLTNPDNAIFLAFDEETAAAFANCSLRHDYVEGTDSNPVGYLEGIYVRPEYRGRGAARALVSLCEDWSRARGCAEFASDCELDNTDSLRFHLKIGFDEVNRVICFTKEL